MKKEINTEQNEKKSDFPYGWNKGDLCIMITNKAKKYTAEYVVENYDGRYFGVRSHTETGKHLKSGGKGAGQAVREKGGFKYDAFCKSASFGSRSPGTEQSGCGQ